MDPELAAFMAERQTKQDYLRDEIAAKGYDQVMFAQFITERKGILTCLMNLNRKWN